MFRGMRRYKQQLSDEECAAVLGRATSGVLAVHGDGGYPYAVPLSFVYMDDKIYFHCAKTGHKMDAILADDKVSFCVIDKDDIIPEEFTTYFRSVIAFGRAAVVEDPVEKRRVLHSLAEKYSPEMPVSAADREIDGSFAAVCIVGITVDHMTGKAARELMG
ncbi:MAG: pyridoxamine 5'-phosphate oxidase family protein [Clostridia bacterium]|nr:pyridoxamine 5'-phosphate oxidase family protein [Clostridia bacterium]